MSIVGDGKKRSNKRRLTELVSLRMDAAEKVRLTQAARRDGYTSLSAWILDRVRAPKGRGARSDLTMSGKIGVIGAHISRLPSLSEQDRIDVAKKINAALVAIQKELAGEVGNDRQEDRQ
ncbi:MAG: hypothetical protein ACRCVZ_05090 [Aestuariivirga sp.]